MTDPNVPGKPEGSPESPSTPDLPETAPAAAEPAVPAAPEAPAAPPAAPAVDFGAAAAPVPPAPAYDAPPAPAYGAPTYGAPTYGASTAAKTNVLAIVSLVSSLVGFFTGIGFLVGVVCGHISLSQIKKTGEQGRGMALAGLIIGYIGIALSVILTIVFFGILASLSTIDSYTY